ncbi:MAG: HlyD family efflux transporter periplasmic adaptor subunit [Clostridia bacterium]|jgi:putative membrane fusion protein|nr:hypothetical protein [Clostridiales bacterium]
MINATRPKKRKGYIRFAMLAVFTIVLVRAAIGLGDRAPDTALVGHGDVMIAQKVAGVIVRHEMVVKAPISGRVTYAARENVRVPINSKLLEIKRDNIDTDLTDKYKEINDKLQVLQSLEDNSALPAVPDKVVSEGLSNIAYLIDEGNLAMVYYEKERLAREMNYSLAANATQSEREELIRQKEELDGMIEGGIKAEFAPFSGVPVYSLDGYEEALSPKNLKEIIPSSVVPQKVERVDFTKELEAGVPTLKIVDNHAWYFVCNLSEDFAGDLKQGSVVTLDIPGEEMNSIRARVNDIYRLEGELTAAFEAKDFFHGLYEKRHMELTVIKGKYSGLVVPLSAVYEKQGEHVVEVLDADKTIEKKVIVKGHDGTNAVVERADTGPELKMYDKVVLNKDRED